MTTNSDIIPNNPTIIPYSMPEPITVTSVARNSSSKPKSRSGRKGAGRPKKGNFSDDNKQLISPSQSVNENSSDSFQKSYENKDYSLSDDSPRIRLGYNHSPYLYYRNGPQRYSHFRYADYYGRYGLYDPYLGYNYSDSVNGLDPGQPQQQRQLQHQHQEQYDYSYSNNYNHLYLDKRLGNSWNNQPYPSYNDPNYYSYTNEFDYNLQQGYEDKYNNKISKNGYKKSNKREISSIMEDSPGQLSSYQSDFSDEQSKKRRGRPKGSLSKKNDNPNNNSKVSNIDAYVPEFKQEILVSINNNSNNIPNMSIKEAEVVNLLANMGLSKSSTITSGISNLDNSISNRNKRNRKVGRPKGSKSTKISKNLKTNSNSINNIENIKEFDVPSPLGMPKSEPYSEMDSPKSPLNKYSNKDEDELSKTYKSIIQIERNDVTPSSLPMIKTTPTTSTTPILSSNTDIETEINVDKKQL